MLERLQYIWAQTRDSLAWLIGIIITFLTPIWGMLLTVGLFILADTVYAINTAVKKGGWSAFKSTHLFNIVPKTFFYLSGVILGYLVDYFIVDGTIWGISLLITKIVCGFWIYIEIKSIDETSIKRGNKPLWEIIKDLVRKGKDIKKDINEITEK